MQNFCNERRAVIGLITMSVVNFIINIPHFATFTPFDSDGGRGQQLTYRKSDFGKSTGSHYYEFWVHCVFLVLGSWLGILVLNILIIRQVAYVSKNMNNRKSSHGCKKSQRYESQMTRTLLSVSFTFLVLIFPECIAKCFYMLEAVSVSFLYCTCKFLVGNFTILPISFWLVNFDEKKWLPSFPPSLFRVTAISNVQFSISTRWKLSLGNWSKSGYVWNFCHEHIP